MEDRSLYRAAMSRMVSSIAAVATMRDAIPAGIIATAVCGLSDAPPSLLVCVNRASSAYKPLAHARRFSVNLLATDQGEVVARFSTEDGAARFHPDQWEASRRGVPILRGAVVSFDCDLAEEFEGHTHAVVSGIVRGITQDASGEKSCLLWANRRLARHQEL